MRELIIHSMRKHRLQTASIVISVALSFAALLSIALVDIGANSGAELNARRSGAEYMAIPSEASSLMSNNDLLFTGAPAPMYMSADIADTIASMDGIECSTAQFFCQTLDQSCCSTTGATRLIGFDESTDWTVQPFCSQTIPSRLDDDQVIVGSDVAWQGQQQIAILGKTYRVYAQLAKSGTDLDKSILMNIDDARTIARTEQGYDHYWERYGDPNTLASAVLFNIDSSADSERIINRIQAQGSVVVLQRSKIVAESQQQLQSSLSLLLDVALILVAITILQIFGLFFSCVWNRKEELSLYRAIGASTRDLKKLIGGEIAAIVAAGIIAGLAIGWFCYQVVLGSLSDRSAFAFVDPDLFATAAVIVVLILGFALIAVLAMLVPLRQIDRLDPSSAMQQGDVD